ncbi:hypothetical protein ZOSMA_26G01410 [Zostera marina]|uniref:Uncharacterized protein n=1 Tax=Zostera marina TaxID=29655 RepID=A0A0K9PGM8_ZOSMR|nr:hypothetical protein ZOSMA_26G01410 [Zostera marina]
MEVSEFPLSYKSYGPLLKCDMWKLKNHGSTSEDKYCDYVQPIEIHSSSRMPSSPVLINFQLPDILSTELRNSSSFDLNLEYDTLMKSNVLPNSIIPKDIDLCHQSCPDADNNIIDHCQSVSVSKSNSTIKLSSPIPMSDPMPIDPPLDISINNLNHSVCNEDLINSVSCIDLNMNYVSPIKAICRPSFNLLNISDLSDQRNASADVDNIYYSKSFSLTKSIKCIKSSDIIQQSFLTPVEPKMCLDGSTSIATTSNPSVNDHSITLVRSYPLAIQNSSEFWDSAIRSAEEVEARIRITKKHTYEDLSAVARCIEFSPCILTPQFLCVTSAPYKIKKVCR